jgi:hypothetical protein
MLGEMRNAYRSLAEKFEGMNNLGERDVDGSLKIKWFLN